MLTLICYEIPSNCGREKSRNNEIEMAGVTCQTGKQVP